MKYKLLLFFFIFTFIYPVYLRFFPIPTDRILHILGLVFVIFNGKFLNFFINIMGVGKVFISSFIILLMILLFQIWKLTPGLDLYLFKDHFDIFLYFFPALLISSFAYKIDSHSMLVQVLDYIVIAAMVQAIISFI